MFAIIVLSSDNLLYFKNICIKHFVLVWEETSKMLLIFNFRLNKENHE